MVSPKFHVSPHTRISYDIGFWSEDSDAISIGSDDTLQIRISTDCGYSFEPVKTYTKNSIISKTGEKEDLDLSAYEGTEAIIGFYAASGIESNFDIPVIYIDNIRIYNDLKIRFGFYGICQSR